MKKISCFVLRARKHCSKSFKMAAHEDVILPWYQIVLVYISFTFIITLGYINEFFSRVLAPKSRPPKVIIIISE